MDNERTIAMEHPMPSALKNDYSNTDYQLARLLSAICQGAGTTCWRIWLPGRQQATQLPTNDLGWHVLRWREQQEMSKGTNMKAGWKTHAIGRHLVNVPWDAKLIESYKFNKVEVEPLASIVPMWCSGC